MKTPSLPVICGVALTAMSTAGLSHWWSVHQFVAAINAGVPVSELPRIAVPPSATPAGPELSQPAQPRDSIAEISRDISPAPEAHKKDFYEALIAKMENIQNQNRDLLGQIAETNRDIMKLEFRVDTHSESFRPLPVSEDRPFSSSIDSEGPGVLPPRAEPVFLPSY